MADNQSIYIGKELEKGVITDVVVEEGKLAPFEFSHFDSDGRVIIESRGLSHTLTYGNKYYSAYVSWLNSRNKGD